MDSAMRMQYSPMSLLRKSVRGDICALQTDRICLSRYGEQCEIDPYGLWQNTLRPSTKLSYAAGMPGDLFAASRTASVRSAWLRLERLLPS